jgi:hypothetical protein
MSNKELIHLRFDYTEALEGKKDILFVEKRLVEVIGKIQIYKALREQETVKKQKLHRKIKEVLTELKRLDKTIPKVERPEPEVKEDVKVKEVKKGKSKEISKESKSIEDQIREIQEKLSSLQ